MKLKRIHARIIWGLIAASILFLGIAVLFAENGAFAVGFKLSAVIAVVSIILAFYLRLRWFVCPYCEKGMAYPLWKQGKRYYCSCCGKPFIYDDEPDKPLD